MANTTLQSEPSEPSGQTCSQNVLVQRAQAGDRDAFDRLAKQSRPLLFAMAFLRTSHKEEAEDLVQEILTRVWQKLPDLTDPALFLPWLKAITANACITWYRRAGSRPLSLDEETVALLPAERGLPLKALLAQDTQRELQQALLTLPKANRLALLMHIWGGASYEEIAACTGVPASTVDGRIYRAKRQLRRLLYDAGAEFLGEAPRPLRSGPMPNEVLSPRRKKMSVSTPDVSANAWAQPLALVAFTRRFCLMLEAGVSLLRAFEIMATLPAPYGEATHSMRSELEAGKPLSRIMSERPDLFPPVYVGMVRAGELSGVLDEILQRLKKVLAREWALANRHPAQEAPLFLLLPAGKALPGTWEAMSAYQQTVTLSLFFDTFGTLLQSGVPIVQAMKTVAMLLPAASQAGWEKAIQTVYPTGERFSQEMKRMGIFPDFAVEMTLIGEESGTLDSIFHRLAESFEDELEYQGVPTAG